MRCGGFVPPRRLALLGPRVVPPRAPGGPGGGGERAAGGPQPRVLTVERPRPLRAENAGDLRSRWGDSNTQRLAYRASAESGSGVSGITAKATVWKTRRAP